jgi:hypothetical protein
LAGIITDRYWNAKLHPLFPSCCNVETGQFSEASPASRLHAVVVWLDVIACTFFAFVHHFGALTIESNCDFLLWAFIATNCAIPPMTIRDNVEIATSRPFELASVTPNKNNGLATYFAVSRIVLSRPVVRRCYD